MEGSEVREVSFEEALAEENSGSENTETTRPRPAPHAHGVAEDDPGHVQGVPEPSPEPQANSESVPQTDQQREAAQRKEELQRELEILAPPIESREWAFGEGDLKKTYIQSELSVTGSAQWFALLGEFLDKAMSGENALSLNSLLDPPKARQPGQFSLMDFQDADTFVHALGKLLMVMPEFLEKSVCIWLDVPDYEWNFVRELMRQSPKRGGMSHEMFEEILITFIDQNYGEIDRFFRIRFPRLRNRWQVRAMEANQSRSSKR